ncbi:MAG: type I restriction enzyme HsdR N-terminal domain-containing protein [Prevotellaceae bacterium]|nr:type I restriction enzyme HsdR N-terminal domain-containing protein [Prevotellaceae bacterium]
MTPSESLCPLNLPPASLRISQGQDGRLRVFDILRRRHVTLTPEEWVRQHFIHYLITHKGYPAALLANEVSLSLNGLQRRTDSVLYDRQAQPRMLIEYKAPSVALSQKVFDQISRYNITMRVPYLIVSNGLQHYCCSINYEEGNYRFLREIPSYGEL